MAPVVDVSLESVQEKVVEESETTLESPAEVQEVVEEVHSPSLPTSSGYSNIFSFTADDVVDQFFKGAGIGIDFYFQFLSSYL